MVKALLSPHRNRWLSFAERLSFLREERQLTQAQLAAKSGLSQTTIGNLETGRNKGTKKILELANALQITPEWLIHGGNLAQAKGAFRKDTGVLPAEETGPQHLLGLISRAQMAPVVEDEPETGRYTYPSPGAKIAHHLLGERSAEHTARSPPKTSSQRLVLEPL